MQKTRDFFPLKTSHHLSDITGYSLRTCEYWLSEKVVIPSDALAALIQSEWGREYLAAIMSDATPKWWTTLKAFLKRITYEAAVARQEQQYRELLEDEAAARFVTPRLQDDPFFEGQPSPYRKVARKVKR